MVQLVWRQKTCMFWTSPTLTGQGGTGEHAQLIMLAWFAESFESLQKWSSGWTLPQACCHFSQCALDTICSMCWCTAMTTRCCWCCLHTTTQVMYCNTSLPSSSWSLLRWHQHYIYVNLGHPCCVKLALNSVLQLHCLQSMQLDLHTIDTIPQRC